MGSWKLVEATEDLAKLIVIACANFAYEHGAGDGVVNYKASIPVGEREWLVFDDKGSDSFE